jgi:hypothetical protein
MHHRPLRTARAFTLAVVLAGVAVPVRAAGDEPVRLTIESGTPQTARAWVAARANRYEATFDAALAVNVSPATAKVRFRCITPGCEFPPSDQPDSVTRVDPSAYDVASAKGTASIKLTIWTTAPENVVVVAQPAGRADPQVRFILNER